MTDTATTISPEGVDTTEPTIGALCSRLSSFLRSECNVDIRLMRKVATDHRFQLEFAY
jgi:hypothetical protein